jgi:hypothetical protein
MVAVPLLYLVAPRSSPTSCPSRCLVTARAPLPHGHGAPSNQANGAVAPRSMAAAPLPPTVEHHNSAPHLVAPLPGLHPRGAPTVHAQAWVARSTAARGRIAGNGSSHGPRRRRQQRGGALGCGARTAVPRAGEVTASGTPALRLDHATRPTPCLLIFTVPGLRIPGDKFCSSACGLQLNK